MALRRQSALGEPAPWGLLAGSLAVAYRSAMLVGRDAEQQRLDLLLRQAQAGTSGVLVLRGDPAASY